MVAGDVMVLSHDGNRASYDGVGLCQEGAGGGQGTKPTTASTDHHVSLDCGGHPESEIE